MEKKQSLLTSKLLYTFIMVFVYLVGKNIPLFMLDLEAYVNARVDAEALLMQTLSGDVNQSSIFALGITPYMLSSIFVSIFFAFRSKEARKRVSNVKRNRMTLQSTLVLSTIMAITQVQELQFRAVGEMIPYAKAVATIEMVAGAFFVINMVTGIKKYGIGGQSALIYLNIVDGIYITLKGHNPGEYVIPLLISLFVLVIMLFMENTELRIPLQRISIHNIYADKNYLAIKLNPIGVMPAIFATAFFMLPQLIVSLLGGVFPDKANIIWLQENMVLTKHLGIAIYAILLYVLTMGFSRVMINPKEYTENFLKSGDSIRDLHAGRDTRKYLSCAITILSFVSATVMSICLCVPMLLQVSGEIETVFATLPSSVMMLTGIWCNLSREIASVRDLDSYKPFI